MCLGFPGMIEILGSNMATVDIAGSKREVSTLFIGEENLKVGDWVMVHAGFAMSKMDEAEAKESLEFMLDLARQEEEEEQKVLDEESR